jgi:hypothetical protein
MLSTGSTGKRPRPKPDSRHSQRSRVALARCPLSTLADYGTIYDWEALLFRFQPDSFVPSER